jgi:hypothetical protein
MRANHETVSDRRGELGENLYQTKEKSRDGRLYVFGGTQAEADASSAANREVP